MAAAEILRRLDYGIFHREIVGVPDAGPGHLKPGAVLGGDVFRVPEGIFPLEHAVFQVDIAGLL